MVRRRLSLPFTDVKEDDEVVTDEEIIGNGRVIMK